MHNELDELHRQLKARHGNYGSSLASVKMTSQAFKQFEMNVQVIENKIQNFVSTAEMMIQNHPTESRRIRHEVDEAQKRWTAFYTSIGEYSGALEKSTTFFEILEVVSSHSVFSLVLFVRYHVAVYFGIPYYVLYTSCYFKF